MARLVEVETDALVGRVQEIAREIGLQDAASQGGRLESVAWFADPAHAERLAEALARHGYTAWVSRT